MTEIGSDRDSMWCDKVEDSAFENLQWPLLQVLAWLVRFERSDLDSVDSEVALESLTVQVAMSKNRERVNDPSSLLKKLWGEAVRGALPVYGLPLHSNKRKRIDASPYVYPFEASERQLPDPKLGEFVLVRDSRGERRSHTMVEWRSLHCDRDDVLWLWPEVDRECPRGPGRPLEAGQINDISALEDMHSLIKSGQATSVLAAAKKVAESAQGIGTFESKVERLRKKYQKWVTS